jgi:hypothetical protein
MTGRPSTPDQPRREPGSPDAAVAGLAREVEALRRRLDQLQPLPQRIQQLADLLARHAETAAATTSAPATSAPPSWLDLPADPGRPAASSPQARAAATLLTTLADWVAGIYLRYRDAAQSLPECWLWHPDVVEELLWLHTAWLAAHRPDAASTAVGDWHDRHRPGVVRRIRDYAGLCSLEQHQPGADRHAAVRTAPLTEAVPAIAAWWATHRTEPAPAPTREQLDGARCHESARDCR